MNWFPLSVSPAFVELSQTCSWIVLANVWPYDSLPCETPLDRIWKLAIQRCLTTKHHYNKLLLGDYLQATDLSSGE